MCIRDRYIPDQPLLHILKQLYPHKKFSTPKYLESKNYNFLFVNHDLNADSEELLLNSIAEQLDLQKTNSKTIRREVELKLKKDKLLVPAKRENRSLPKFEENILTLSHNTIANMAEAISLRSDYYFKTNINSQKTYQFTIDLSSYESINCLLYTSPSPRDS